MAKRDVKHYGPFTLSGANERTRVILCKDFRNVDFDISSDAAADMTIRVYAALSETAPNPTSPVGTNNRYSTFQCIDLRTGSPVDGDTGIVISELAAFNNQYELNENASTYVFLEVETYTSGSVNIDFTLADNQ